jgi:hypothetical protein
MTQRPNGPPEDQPHGPAVAAKHSPAETWQDWVTIWQSELNALATDREAQQAAQQAWAKLVALWATQARAAGAFLPRRGADEPACGRARAESPPGSAAPAAAPDAGVIEQQRLALEHLARRVAELERRLRELGGDGPG